MQIIIAILTGILSVANYVWQSGGGFQGSGVIGIIAQSLLTIVIIVCAVTYAGKKTRPNYKIGRPRIFTLGFGVILLSALGNLCVLAVLILHAAGALTAW